MKIDGMRPLSPAKRKDRAKSGESSDFDAAGEAGEARSSSAASSMSGISSVDALLALQADWGEDKPKQQASARAFGLLDILDEIKIGLLEGGIPLPKLNQLVRALGESRDATGDEKLEGLLDEVETRARVELAKHESVLI